MSLKTPRLLKSSAIVLTRQRSVLKRIDVAACAIGLLVLAPVTSFALELGDAAIRSGLGQSLRVEIPYRLASGERLTPACVRLVPSPQGDAALPTYSRATRIAVTATHIEILGDNRVLEPLIGITVDVHCATTPRFVRSYQLFVDPPGFLPAPSVPLEGTTTPAAITGPASSTEAARTSRASTSARARGQTGGALTQGQTYLVVRGDTLSGIAARIDDRRATIREAAEAIFASNPAAFTRGNRDLLEAGRSITIPVLAAAEAAPTPAEPALREARRTELITASPVPSTELAPAATSEMSPPPAEAVPRVVVPEVEQPSAAGSVVRPSAAPVPMTIDAAPESASPAAPQHASGWLTALLAIGVVTVLSTSWLLLRRRKQAAAMQDRDNLRSPRQRLLVDPVGGFDVVEGQLAAEPSGSSENAAAATESNPLALDIGPTDSVDLDVGAPLVEEPADWFGDRSAVVAAANPVADATIEDAATARMPDIENAATVVQPPPTIDDQQHTLTIVELDMLRQDYEAEHTLTQEASKQLRDALADLKITQAARAAGADTATMEMLQPDTSETQPTQKLRSSR